MNRRVFKAYLLKESLERLVELPLRRGHAQLPAEVDGSTEVAAADAVRDLAAMLLKHLDGIVNYCRTKVRFGVVEAVNGNIRMLINRGRGYKNLRYLLLKAKRLAVTNIEFIAVCSVKKAA
jgi:transposase